MGWHVRPAAGDGARLDGPSGPTEGRKEFKWEN